jgi:hypothetical protein
MEPIKDASVWTGDDLQRDRSWEFALTSEHGADLDRALQKVKARGLQLAEITREDFPLPSLDKTLRTMLDELRDGKGFVFVRGFSTEGYALDDMEKLYWGFSTHLGTGVTQNSEAGLVAGSGLSNDGSGAHIVGRYKEELERVAICRQSENSRQVINTGKFCLDIGVVAQCHTLSYILRHEYNTDHSHR